MKRPRGRNQNSNMNRRGQGNLSRNYESNGPDIKVRGTAHQIAEKYVQLWRDALSAGDVIAAENYLQHAEHYYRIVASIQAPSLNGAAITRADDDRFDSEDSFDSDEDDGQDTERDSSVRNEQPSGRSHGGQGFSQPRENRERDGRPQRDNFRHNRDNREPRSDYRQPREDRQPREARPVRQAEEGFNGNDQENRPAREQRSDFRNDSPREERQPREARQDSPREPRTPRSRTPRPRYNNQNDGADVGELPSFITGGSSSPISGNAPFSQTGAAPVLAPVTPLSVAPDHSGIDADNDTEATTPAPRRRYRTREAAPVDAGDAETPVAAKPAPRRRVATARKENIEAE